MGYNNSYAERFDSPQQLVGWPNTGSPWEEVLTMSYVILAVLAGEFPCGTNLTMSQLQ